MAVFRVEKNSGYTVMSNHHLRNRALSLKAKGLLSQMLSLPEDWDYTLQGLARINRESIDAIRQAIRELEQAGYIQRSRERDEKGRLRGADYVIFELPQPVPASVSPTLENPTLENPTQENPTLENEKTILFLIMSDTDTTFNFILAMLQSQLINLLCDRADDKYGGRLPVHVRLILDEFANIGQIPNFDKLIATIRSREISASIILQSQSQLKAIYKDAAEIISDNCDSVLFLSGRGKNAKEISDALGKETIDSFNTSENRGSQTSHGLNYQKLGKALMSEDEIAIMDGGRCILQLRGVRPFFSEKFDITKHPHYKYLADADKKNTFEVDRFLSTLRRKRQQVVAQDESFDLYEIDLSDEDAAAE